MLSAKDFITNSADYPLSITQYAVLLKLSEVSEPTDFGAIAEGLGVSRPAMSRAVEALEGEDMIKRAVDPSDRRRALLSLKAKGRKVVEAIS